MYRMTDEEFDRAVDEALDCIPPQFLDALENVAIAVQDEPDAEQLAAVDGSDPAEFPMHGDELLGLYDGTPLTERGNYDFDLPDMVTIFKGPHERSFGSREEIVEEIRKTVVHEIGHYFGLDDEALHRMGY